MVSVVIVIIAVPGSQPHPDVVTLVIITAAAFGLGVVAHSRIRYRVHAALAAVGQTTEEREAAAVAALVGRVGVEKVLELATRTFCVLPFSELMQRHFERSVPGT